MKKILILLLFISCSCLLFSQQLPIKEDYDEVYKAYLAHDADILPLTPFPSSEEPGSNMYGTYESLLDMYETTGDKAYLYKFMTAAI